MPRSPRIEFSGARYHVINRGNYRQDLFRIHKTGEQFEGALFETCDRFGWLLHAYVVMSNHYHLALETPEGNLSNGMQFLQSKFSNRFNLFVKERGHVFQGRYKSLILEDDWSLINVVDYIHLNPVRAGIVTLNTLLKYELGSYPKYFRKNRPKCLRCEDFLAEAGGLRPGVKGMNRYTKRLALCLEEDPSEREKVYASLRRGWYVGSDAGKQRLLEMLEDGRAMANAIVLKELGEQKWNDLLASGMSAIGKDASDALSDLKSADWKLALGYWIKSRCGVSNRWLSESLNMGDLSTASAHISRYGRERSGQCPLCKLLNSIP